MANEVKKEEIQGKPVVDMTQEELRLRMKYGHFENNFNAKMEIACQLARIGDLLDDLIQEIRLR